MEPIKLLLQGDVVTIVAIDEHWHGATPDSIFSHIAIQLIADNGQDISLLTPVTDEESIRHFRLFSSLGSQSKNGLQQRWQLGNLQ